MFAMSIRQLAAFTLASSALLLTACGGGGSSGSNGGGAPSKAATLEVVKTGGGAGTVSGPGINCGPSCSAGTTIGTVITLSATADNGQMFDGWGGDVANCGATTTCSLTVSSARPLVKAGFSVIPVTAPAPTTLVTAVLSGNGNGSVTSSPAGINCSANSDSDCSETYNQGGTINLTAIPTANSTFSSWSGGAAGCGSTSTCTLSLTGNAINAVANFSLVPTTLVSAVISGNGMGTVTSNPAGINCTQDASSDCSETYSQGGMVTLSAAPLNANNLFVRWGGDAAGCGTSANCTLMLTSSVVNAVASFQPISRSLAVNKTGSGSVTSSPAGINCGSSCSTSYQQGSMVTLTATADSGFTFQGFGGACTGTAPCTVTMDADKNVTATFLSTNVTLNVSKLGNGIVSSSPAGIDCGSTCSASYARGTAVTLTAAASGTDVFQGWGGSCTGTAPCSVTLNTDSTNVTASFAAATGQTPGELYGLTNANRIVSFSRSTPGTFSTAAAITGLPSGETAVAIDTRPADQKIYLLTNAGRLYTVDLVSGAASFKSTLVADSADATAPYTALSGNSFGMDFNPTVDRLRLVSDTGKNLRINADSGVVITDADLNQASSVPKVVDTAYTFNYVAPANSTPSTSLFAIDTGSGTLNLISAPNSGTQTLIGPLGFNFMASAGFEIMGTNIDAFTAGVVISTVPQGALYSVDLRTGAATSLGNFAGNEAIISMSARIVAAQTATPGDLALLTTTGKLVTVNRNAPETALTSVNITGIPAAESLMDLEYRTSDRALYVLTRAAGNVGKFYKLDIPTGAATLVSTISGTSTALTGNNISMDFEPTSAANTVGAVTASNEKVRVVSDSGVNLLVTVDSGVGVADTGVASTTALGGVGYTNAFLQATASKLYVVDAASRNLLRLADSGGATTTVGALGLSTLTLPLGFDINGTNNEGLLSVNESGAAKLYSINLDTGAAGSAMNLGLNGETVRATALRPAQEPQMIAVLTGSANAAGSTPCPTGAVCLVSFTTQQMGSYPGYTNIRQPFALASGVTLLGMDFRPRTGDLVALGSDSKLYTVDPATGAATVLNTLSNDPSNAVPFTATTLAATGRYGVNFNPNVDRLRITGGLANVNLRVNVDTGVVLTDTNVGRPPFAISGASYNSAGTLYGLDTASDRLFTIDTTTAPQSATGGRLAQIGALGIDLPAISAMKIIGASEIYAAGKVAGAVNFYALASASGKAALRGPVPLAGGTCTSGTDIRGMTFSTATSNLQAITDTLCLVEFDRVDGTAISARRVSNIATTETVIGMDYLNGSANSTLYVVTKINGSDNAKLYTVNPANGAATAVTSVMAGPPPSTATLFALPAGASTYGVAIPQAANATTVRITTDKGGNIDVNLTTLAVTGQANINQTVPVVTAAAYTRNYLGSRPTTAATVAFTKLLDIDTTNNSLMSQGLITPNDGQLFDLATLGISVNTATAASGAFEIIGGDDGFAMACFRAGTAAVSGLYRANLAASSNALTLSNAIGRTSGNTNDSTARVEALAIRLPQ